MNFKGHMNHNTITIVLDENGVSGLKCQCGNFESITDENPSYKRFGYWMDSPTKTSKGCCRVCNSEVTTVAVSKEVMEKTNKWYADKLAAEKKS
jgi:hypothetical protein